MPEKIDNSKLICLETKDIINPELKERIHFVFINEITWQVLKELYKAHPELKFRPFIPLPQEESHNSTILSMGISIWEKKFILPTIGLENNRLYCFMNSSL